MSCRLRELIRAVRACKTAADERDVIAKECAAIRTAFKDEDNPHRHRNVAKLLFIHMLGYPTHFGQMECLKLIASSNFPEKRIGYLGLMLLLDESQEVLMLVTNSLQNDMRHSVQYVTGLALCALGDIGSQDICRDLCGEVELLTTNSNSYIRKKAALCAVRICRKCPEMIENFVERLPPMLSDRNHGVLLGALTLLVELCQLSEETIPALRKLVPALVKILKNISLSGFAPEHDIGGITDPFLQVKLLHALRLLGKGDAEATELMTDILASVATNTEGSKNAGNAILYECVLTIMGIESDKGLRVLAVNILGRFLINRDNNIRYVALNTLAKTCAAEVIAIQRHRNTVIDCLKDPDVSIRRRALDLIYLLVNETTVRVLVRELLNFLTYAEAEFKADLTDKICAIATKFAPNMKWQVDILVKVLVMSGENVQDSVGASLVDLISTAPELQIYSVHKLFHALKAEPLTTIKRQLVRIGVWMIGEYGELMSMAPPHDADEVATGPIADEVVVDLLESILTFGLTTLEVKKFVLTALMKLTSRLDSCGDRIKELIAHYRTHINVELQERSCEFYNTFDLGEVRRLLLEHMPSVADADTERDTGMSGTSSVAPAAVSSGDIFGLDAAAPAPTQTKPSVSNIMDDLFGLDLGPSHAPAPAPPAAVSGGGSSNLLDLLSDLSMPAPAPAPAPMPLVMGGAVPSSIPTSSGPTTVVAFQQNGLTISFEVVKHPSNMSLTQINATFLNSLPHPMINFVFQAAVPKFAKLQMSPASASVIPPNNAGAVTQVMRISNSLFGQKSVGMRLKFEYSLNGEQVSGGGDAANLPSNI